MGDAIMDVAEAQKSYNDILTKTAEETANTARELADKELSFHLDILNQIEDAYTGTLSYLNSMEKAEYLDRTAQLKLNSGDSQGYFDTLYKQLEYEKATSTTKESYIPKFERYIAELSKAEPEEDPVVEKLDDILEQNVKIEEAISRASYQGSF